MTNHTLNFKYDFSHVTQRIPNAYVSKLQQFRYPVRYPAEIVPELPNTMVTDLEDIKGKTREQMQVTLLLMLQHCFEAMVEAGRTQCDQWPLALRVLAQKQQQPDGQYSSNYGTFLHEGDPQLPMMCFPAYGINLDMSLVPVFMEWMGDDGYACRVLLDSATNRFYVLHLQYALDDQGYRFQLATLPELTHLYSFSMDDLTVVSRLKSIDAAFTPIYVDDEGVAQSEQLKLHDHFQPYALCH